MCGNLGAVVKKSDGFQSVAGPASTIAAAGWEVNVPRTNASSFVYLWEALPAGERGDFLQKSPPFPPRPLSPSKTLLKEDGRELLSGKASPDRWSPGGTCDERHFSCIG